MKLHKVAIVSLCLILLTGCWSRRELNDLMIVLGIGIDWEDGEYVVSFQVVNPAQISAQKQEETRAPGTLYQGRGKSVFEAARSLTAEAPRKVYVGHLQLYVIGEKLARRGISDMIDNMLRDNEARMDFNVVIARGTTAESILKLYTPLEKLPTNNMLLSLKTSEKNWAPTVSITLDEVLDQLSTVGSELAVTGIRLIGNKEMADSPQNVAKFRPPSRFRYSGIAVFKKDKLIGWLNENESKGYTDITNRLESTSIQLPCGKNRYTVIEVTSSESKMRASVRNGEPVIRINVRSEGNIVGRHCPTVDVTDPATIAELDREASTYMRAHSEAAVKKAKALKSDILGFGVQLAKEHPVYWKTVKDDWNEHYFPNVQVEYDIKLNIRKTGTIGNTTLQD